MQPDFEQVREDKKSTREFYLQCVETVTRTSYGRNVLDLVQECRQAASQVK
jgi:hypothetical protein